MNAPNQPVAQDGANTFYEHQTVRYTGKPHAIIDTFQTPVHQFRTFAEFQQLPFAQQVAAEDGFVGFFVEPSRRKHVSALYSDGSVRDLGRSKAPVDFPLKEQLRSQSPAQPSNAGPAQPAPATATG